MKKLILTLIILCLNCYSFSQSESNSVKFNFDFENQVNGLPYGWSSFGSSLYSLYLDSTGAKSGKNSAVIELTDGTPDFSAWAFTLPENYNGKKITLTGYVKTENVNGGYAGLWMRIDPDVAFNNMDKVGMKGTNDWTKCSITLTMDPKKTEQIVLGGLLVGKGKMWLDDLRVSIDGKSIEGLAPLERKIFPLEKDKTFDHGSSIILKSPTEQQLKNLKTLGYVWGFLKYYHPAVAEGKVNWDYELFRVMPEILNAANTQERDQIFVNWIEKLGEFQVNKKSKKQSKVVKFDADLEWLKTEGFSPELAALLEKVRQAKRPKENYYITLEPNVGNPNFKNEKSYSSMKYPDAGYRLLSLYRYWNIIQYYFPYKDVIGENWNGVLTEFIPRFVDAKDESEYTLAVLELIERVHDTHANIWGNNEALNTFFGVNNPAVELTFIEEKAVVTGYYDDTLGVHTGLKIGDIITHVNDKSVEKLIQSQKKFTPASNYPTQLREIASKLLRTNDSLISVAFLRDGMEMNVTMKTFPVDQVNKYSQFHVPDSAFRMISKDIAYINNGSIQRKELSKIWDVYKDSKGLIIDIRNYPTDFVIYSLSNYLMPDKTEFVKFTEGSINVPGQFTFTEPLTVGKKNKEYYKGKVIILVNEQTQSSAEFHAMAYLVHPNSTVIGSTTAGADGNVSRILLPGGIYTVISGIGVFYPDGKETQLVGIVPDLEVKPTIEGFKEGRDEVLEKAVELINGL